MAVYSHFGVLFWLLKKVSSLQGKLSKRLATSAAFLATELPERPHLGKERGVNLAFSLVHTTVGLKIWLPWQHFLLKAGKQV